MSVSNYKVNVDTYYDAFLSKYEESNGFMGEYISACIDLEMAVRIWLAENCLGGYFYETTDKQRLCFDALSDYTKFLLRWC